MNPGGLSDNSYKLTGSEYGSTFPPHPHSRFCLSPSGPEVRVKDPLPQCQDDGRGAVATVAGFLLILLFPWDMDGGKKEKYT